MLWKSKEKIFVCNNCSYVVKTDDKYCRKCGNEIGKGAYVPTEDIMQCIYGPPPIERDHTCEKCGYSWSTCLMVDCENRCPKCGGNAPYTKRL